MEPIFVSGATGKLAEPSRPNFYRGAFPFMLLFALEDARSDELRSHGAQIVVGDVFEYDSLVNALSGTIRAFYWPPMNPYIAQSALAFAFSRRAGCGRSL